MADQNDPRDLLRRSFAQSSGTIAHVGPGEMTLPTPCDRFDVRTLIGHMLFGANRIGSAGRREAIPVDGPAVVGLGDREWSPAFYKSAQEALDAWSDPGAFSGEIVLPFGAFPAHVVACIYVMEQVVHSWDLATATDSTSLLDPELAEAAMPIARQMVTPDIRSDDESMPFGPLVEVPPDAPWYDRLVGHLGRQPEWGTLDSRRAG